MPIAPICRNFPHKYESQATFIDGNFCKFCLQPAAVGCSVVRFAASSRKSRQIFTLPDLVPWESSVIELVFALSQRVVDVVISMQLCQCQRIGRSSEYGSFRKILLPMSVIYVSEMWITQLGK